MASRPGPTRYFLATGPDSDRVRILQESTEMDVLDPAQRRWQVASTLLRVEGGKALERRDKGIYEASDGSVYRSDDPGAP